MTALSISKEVQIQPGSYFRLTQELAAGSVVRWSFSIESFGERFGIHSGDILSLNHSLAFDIKFSMHFIPSSQAISPNKRTGSVASIIVAHETRTQQESGTFTSPRRGKLQFLWDNEYSRLFAKVVRLETTVQ